MVAIWIDIGVFGWSVYVFWYSEDFGLLVVCAYKRMLYLIIKVKINTWRSWTN